LPAHKDPRLVAVSPKAARTHPEGLRRQLMAMVCDIDVFCKWFEQNLQN
jgi:hypothetical protein